MILFSGELVTYSSIMEALICWNEWYGVQMDRIWEYKGVIFYLWSSPFGCCETSFTNVFSVHYFFQHTSLNQMALLFKYFSCKLYPPKIPIRRCYSPWMPLHVLNSWNYAYFSSPRWSESLSNWERFGKIQIIHKGEHVCSQHWFNFIQ